MSIRSKQTASGIRIVACSDPDTKAAVVAARNELEDGIFQHIIVFFSVQHNADQLLVAMREEFPDSSISGCTTAGEIGPLGMMQGSIVMIAFPETGFRVMSDVIPDIDKGGIAQAAAIARRLRIQMIGSGRRSTNHIFALVLVDGLSNAEESLAAALNWSLDDIELIGGSAGDGLEFVNTALLHRGRVIRRGALLYVIESAYPFQIFKTHNFEPTDTKFVVTSADSKNRIVHELNAEIAATEYANAIGVLPEDVGPLSSALHPLVVKVGGEYYCRSIRNQNPDGSLSFYCAIDEGLIFTLARQRDMVTDTRGTLERIDADLGGTDFVLGFECILRPIDAESRQMRHVIEEIYSRYGVVGFHTYGEQFNAMHLNQTLTGIAFSKHIEKPD